MKMAERMPNLGNASIVPDRDSFGYIEFFGRVGNLTG